MKYEDTNDYIQQLDSPLKEVAEKLRTIINASSPDFVEQLKWNVPTYSLNKNICSIMAHKHHVNLQIMQGALLEDSDLLDGTGRGMRHIKFSNVDEIDTDLISNLLKQAIKLDQ